MTIKLYRIQVEVGPMAGTQLPKDFLGAFVNVYVPAKNIRTAIDLAEDYLLKDKYEPVETTAAALLDIDNEEDVDIEEGNPTRSDLLDLIENGGCWYSPFHGWTSVE